MGAAAVAGDSGTDGRTLGSGHNSVKVRGPTQHERPLGNRAGVRGCRAPERRGLPAQVERHQMRGVELLVARKVRGVGREEAVELCGVVGAEVLVAQPGSE